MVLGVFEVRVRRAESRGRDPGEPEADGPKGWCLQDTPEIINARSFQRPNGSLRWKPRQLTIQMETEANGPFRWIPSSRMSKNDRKVGRFPFTSTNPVQTHTHYYRQPPRLHIDIHHQTHRSPTLWLLAVPHGYPGPHPHRRPSHGVRVCVGE